MLKPTKRCAGVFIRRGNLFFQPYYRTTAGVLIGGGPVEILEDSASDQEIGQVLQVTLDRTKKGVPHPTEFDEIPDLLCEAVGVKSWSTLIKGTKSCEIADDGKVLTITPTRNAGARRGFQFLNDLTLELPSDVRAADLGRSIRLAINRAE